MSVKPSLTWEEAVQKLRSDPGKQDLVRACFYDDPIEEAANRYWESSEWRELRTFLPASKGDVLDLGSGRGISAYAFARDGWRTTALEPDASAVVGAGAIASLASAAALPISVVQEWGESLPFPDGAFDVVHCRAVLHHARDLRQLCREVARVLRPGGTFIGTREHVVSKVEDIELFQAAHPLHREYGGENAYLLTEYISALEAAGFKIKRLLNPMESDINLYPETRSSVRKGIARKFGIPAALVPYWFLSLYGARSNVPGRHYSFISIKAKEVPPC